VNDLPNRLGHVIAQRRLIADGQTALVAVSGGVDSMVLLHALAELSTQHNWKLIVAHFNHQLRGRQADADEKFVGQAARKLGLPFVSDRGDVKDYAVAHKLSIEMAARKLRHEFLAQTAKKFHARHVFLAHHADDQVELFFLRLLRGAGSQGLGGMEWNAPSPARRGLRLLRPLLGETKASLEEYAREQGIACREDATNRSSDILRNRVRRELLPLLRRDFAPALDRAVLRSMELVRDDAEFVTFEAAKWLRRKRRETFASLHVALQRRVIQIGLLGLGVVPQFDQVEHLRTRANNWLTLQAGLICRRLINGRIEARPAESAGFQPGETRLLLDRGDGDASCGLVTLKWKFSRGNAIPPHSVDTECFDADAVGSDIVVRHWRKGDRFQPIGMKQPVKLQDFFTNQKIPRTRRHELVLATTQGGEIFWVEGARIGERFKITPSTRRILEWNWRRS
jgi:tRNA(Ile)-lysidine synthase